MTNKQAIDLLSWSNGEVQSMNFAATLLRQAVRTLGPYQHLLRPYQATLLRVTAEHLEIKIQIKEQKG